MAKRKFSRTSKIAAGLKAKSVRAQKPASDGAPRALFISVGTALGALGMVLAWTTTQDSGLPGAVGLGVGSLLALSGLGSLLYYFVRWESL